MKLDLVDGKLVDTTEEPLRRFRESLSGIGMTTKQVETALTDEQIMKLIERYVELDKSIRRFNASNTTGTTRSNK